MTHVGIHDAEESAAGSCDSIRFLDFDGVLVSTSIHAPLEVHRTGRSDRQHGPEVVQATFPMSGSLDLSTPDRSLVLAPPDFVMSVPAEPVDGRADGWHAAGSLVVRVPRARLPLRANLVDRLVGVPLPGGRGIGAILRAYVVGLAGRLEECQPADAIRLASIALDLLTATFAHHLGTLHTKSRKPNQRLLRARIDTFIEQHLANPDLCPDLVAAAHRISLRYLYKLFQDEELSVAATIRRRRLDACRLELATPGTRMRSIQAISTRWGFSDAAQFSHAFRQAYGMSPRDYRNRAMSVDPRSGHELATAAHALPGTHGHP